MMEENIDPGGNMKEDKIIEEMKSKIIFANNDKNKYYGKSRCITSLENGTAVFILKEDEKEWDNNINILYSSLCKVEKNVSLQEFNDHIRKLISLNEFNSYDSIIKYYEKYPMKEYNFIKVAQGITIQDAEYVEHKGITLIRKDFIEKYLEKNILDSEMTSNFLKKLETDNHVVYMKIECAAKDSDKAQEYAIEKFKLIDTCFRFLLKSDNSDKIRFGFYNLNYESTSGMYGYNNDIFISMSEYKYTVCIDKLLNFLFESDLSNRVWELMEKQYLNDMETRVKEAIIWISEATHQNDDAIAYMQCFLALEAILMEQDGFINKSITAQISEYVAFIIGKDKDERISFEKEIKDLYSIRSSIAHGKNKKGISQQLVRIFIIVKTIIVKFLIDKKLMSIRNVKELREYITDLRFE